MRKAVSQRLIATVNVDNACQLAIMAHLHSDEDLLLAALKIMKAHLSAIKGKPSWKEIESNHQAIMTKLLFLGL